MLRIAKLISLLSVLLLLPIVAAAQADKCEPQVDMAALLSNVDVNGSLYVSELYGRCLPKPAKVSPTAFEYNPYDGGKLSMTLKDSGGKTINTYFWYGHQIGGLWELSRYEIVGGAAAVKKLTPGSYMLEFAIEDKVFQQFPFSVSTRESSDQFRPETLFVTDGPWRSYAQIYAPNLDRFFQLFVWLRNDDQKMDPKGKKTSLGLRLVRDSDKKVVGVGDANDIYNLSHKWQSYKLSFRRPGAAEAKDYSEFKLSEIAAADGKYRIELTADGKPYSEYIFTVKSGRINNLDLAQMRKENYRIIIPLTNERK